MVDSIRAFSLVLFPRILVMVDFPTLDARMAWAVPEPYSEPFLVFVPGSPSGFALLPTAFSCPSPVSGMAPALAVLPAESDSLLAAYWQVRLRWPVVPVGIQLPLGASLLDPSQVPYDFVVWRVPPFTADPCVVMPHRPRLDLRLQFLRERVLFRLPYCVMFDSLSAVDDASFRRFLAALVLSIVGGAQLTFTPFLSRWQWLVATRPGSASALFMATFQSEVVDFRVLHDAVFFVTFRFVDRSLSSESTFKTLVWSLEGSQVFGSLVPDSTAWWNLDMSCLHGLARKPVQVSISEEFHWLTYSRVTMLQSVRNLLDKFVGSIEGAEERDYGDTLKLTDKDTH